MTVSSQLTTDLRKLVLRLEDDLRERLAQDDVNLSRWKAEHQGALDAQRTSSAWQAWRDDKITQAAVAWILTTVFVRFAEDNALVRPVWISGPGARRQEALDAQIVFFRAHPELTDREWLLEPVEYLMKLPATADLVGEHSALWQVQPSGRMATEILEFWRRTNDAGQPIYNLADSDLSTRFLGDLYQDLSDYAKKTFALLQTPEFVEEFILDQTLTPALVERPLEGFKLIDPTCGSGHFLLGAFARLTEEWSRQAPGLDRRASVQKALDAVHGVDLNPFAVAIARFRLTVAALKACSEQSLELAPAFDFHLAAGDSLLHGQVQREFQFEGFDADARLSGFSYVTEDLEALKRILKPGQYDVVVGNPPYITVKDKTLNEAYRKRYATCKGTYALTVPFMERFFGLAKHGTASQPAGWTGQITSNSFMKREFGSKLIEDYLSRQDLRLVVDSEGAWIPGHNMDGTPTVILVGRHQPPVGPKVRAVLGNGHREPRSSGQRGGPYWQSIVSEILSPGFSNDWIDVVDLERKILSTHPWSLSGGGAGEVVAQMAKNGVHTLNDIILGKIGFASFPGADDCFFSTQSELGRSRIPADLLKSVISGDGVRDWAVNVSETAFVPYDLNARIIPFSKGSPWAKRLWPLRTVLGSVTGFGGETQKTSGKPWWGWYRWVASRYSSPLTLTFAEVATHNHFVLDRGGKVFNRSAPVVKLPASATEDDHLALLGLLNSSIICFWLKQKCKAKGGAADYAWARTYQFNGGNVGDIPLPVVLPLERGRNLDALARELSTTMEEAFASGLPDEAVMENALHKRSSILRKMVAEQEELDWETYRLFGLLSSDSDIAGSELPDIEVGERAFEIALASTLPPEDPGNAWFVRHGSSPVVKVPSRWPESYRQLVQRRLHLIESNPTIRLLEQPQFKRRWASESGEKQRERALRSWLLDRLEERSLWFDRQGRPVAKSVSQLSDAVSRDPDFLSVLSLWTGSRDIDVVKALGRLAGDESVPYLSSLRLKDSGLRKRQAWESTWDLQRREDAGEDVGATAVPPNYKSEDFQKPSWWQARGKLDVPKERFILYPDAGRSTDQTLLLGWAGWNHVEQFLALAAIMDQLIADGAPDEQLVPLVAGMGELVQWVKQWHAEIDPAYGVSMADFCTQQFEQRAAQIDRSQDQLKAWRPATPTRGRRTMVTQ
ncbi:BREX-2 system adenine-specific DNA-methyltransferase PglX [Pseudarthrobacter sp. O4]|uniref:BREX-2 system adenine-specific DNA-methyltransferase PglX n=1 Tax=Pseudarthrobacter sp. O4 TaxID=3418417 RepID=UPI003CEF6F5E